jgi:hypothetical protein
MPLETKWKFIGVLIGMVIVAIVVWLYCIKPLYAPWRNGSLAHPARFRQLLNDYGVVIIPQVFTPEEVCAIYRDTKHIPATSYGDIHSPYKRRDKALPLAHMKPYLKTLYAKSPEFWSHVFPDYTLAECSLLTSYSGAKAQPWHSDTEYDENALELVSMGITLCDVDATRGPLEVFPGGINNRIISWIDDEYTDCILNGYSPTACTCPAGSLVFWSSQVVHRGSANRSRENRPVFYVSFLESPESSSESSAIPKTPPQGATYTLSPADRASLPVAFRPDALSQL